MLKLLIVAAWEPELARFRERMAGGTPQREVEVALDTLGVGLVEAAIAMTRCAARHRPSAALLIGTCGAFAPASGTSSTPPLGPGAVVIGARVRLVDGAVAGGEAAVPDPMPVEVAFEAGLCRALATGGARSVQIANTVGITTGEALASRLARASSSPAWPGCAVEHLEAFAFARACAVAGIPCATVLGVANLVGPRGRAEWLANHVEASANAADAAFDALPAIAAELALRTSTKAP